MGDAKSILVVVEPENHPYDVMNRAAWLAGKTGHSVQVLLCDPDIGVLNEGLIVSNEARDLAREINAAQEELADDLANVAREAGIETDADVLVERPIADGILQYALEINPAYLLKGTTYHSAAERSLFLATDWQLIRRCPFPLWLVKERAFADKPVIVAAVDPYHAHDKPASLDRQIIHFANVIRDMSAGDVHLLHTYHRLAGIGREATRTFKPIKLPIDELSQKIRKEHRALLDDLAQEHGIDSDHTHQLPGDTRDILPMFVRSHGADLVVMGATARWGLKRMALGSTAERVLDHLPCDTLIVRAPD